MPLVGVKRWLVGGAESFIHAHFDSGEALWWICPHIENKYRWNDVRVRGRSTSGVDCFSISSSAETNAHTQHTPSRILPLVLSCRLCTIMLIMVVKCQRGNQWGSSSLIRLLPFVIVEALHSFQDISKSDCGNLIGSYYPIRDPSVVDKYLSIAKSIFF